jgi:serine phosphatase RsbU (regulator of sigma subunit)
MLGVDPGSVRNDHRVHLEPGDTLVLYTDGLVERRGSTLSDGFAWLTGLLAETQDTDIEELSDFLLQHAGAPQDDVALLVLRA